MSNSAATTLVQLLPTGFLWPRQTDDLVRDKLLAALGKSYDRVRARADQLLDEADPRTAVEMLAAWETNLSLPDTCADLADTVAERQRRAHAKLIRIGGDTFDYFKGVARALGFEIEIEEHPAATCESHCESSLDPDDVVVDGKSLPWCYVVDIRVPAGIAVFELDCTTGGCDEPLSWWDNHYFECVMRAEFRRRRTTRHLYVRFLYGTEGE